jgi:hypothetical protein
MKAQVSVANLINQLILKINELEKFTLYQKQSRSTVEQAFV